MVVIAMEFISVDSRLLSSSDTIKTSPKKRDDLKHNIEIFVLLNQNCYRITYIGELYITYIRVWDTN